MNKEKKRLLRQASQIHSQLTSSRPQKDTAYKLPYAAWAECQTFLRRMHLARQHGWLLAAHALNFQWQLSLQRLRNELSDLERHCQPAGQSPAVSLRELHADLLALQEEFSELAVDCQQRRISITTEPIELEGVYLGPFEIQLSWGEANQPHQPFAYRVIACEPHPAVSNESLTHPHVLDETLCAGDGHHALQLALEQGRLYDFFMIVTHVLRTYNSSSPYLSLAHWQGVDCADCGNNISDDDSRTCDKCGASVCTDCYFCCGDCDATLCNQCTGICTGCHEHHCYKCLQHCAECDQEVCKDCFQDQERCPDCHAKQNEETNQEPDDQENLDTSPTLHAHGLGKTALPT